MKKQTFVICYFVCHFERDNKLHRYSYHHLDHIIRDLCTEFLKSLTYDQIINWIRDWENNCWKILCNLNKLQFYKLQSTAVLYFTFGRQENKLESDGNIKIHSNTQEQRKQVIASIDSSKCRQTTFSGNNAHMKFNRWAVFGLGDRTMYFKG